jgi:hypothetical protein
MALVSRIRKNLFPDRRSGVEKAPDPQHLLLENGFLPLVLREVIRIRIESAFKWVGNPDPDFAGQNCPSKKEKIKKFYVLKSSILSWRLLLEPE